MNKEKWKTKGGSSLLKRKGLVIMERNWDICYISLNAT